MSTCAVGPCEAPRVEGTSYCGKHGPAADRAKAAAPTAPLVCPHCQTKGQVQARRIRQKAGVSGIKLLWAVLTVGISLLVVGLAKRRSVTIASCKACGTSWTIS